jgi:hypothetical protein
MSGSHWRSGFSSKAIFSKPLVDVRTEPDCTCLFAKCFVSLAAIGKKTTFKAVECVDQFVCEAYITVLASIPREAAWAVTATSEKH